MTNKKILLTGGHAVTTALATIQEISDRNPEFKLFWLTSNKPIEGKKVSYIESEIFPKFGVESYYITAGRIQRRFSRYTLLSLFKIPVGIVQAFFVIAKIKPQVIVSFGGYAGFPAVVAGKILGIPVVLHEQTVEVGLANKISAKFATKIALSNQSSAKYFDPKKIVLTGNPMMKEILEVAKKTRKSFKPTILVTGGSRGSQTINNTLEKILPELLKKYKLIHQTGEPDYELFLEKCRKMNNSNYEVYATIPPQEMGRMYERADIYIGRSGANTVSEIVRINLPSILIPIPWTRFDEQNQNAKKAVEVGVAEILDEDNLAPENLLDLINTVNSNWNKIVGQTKQSEFAINESAASSLANLIISSI